MDLPLGVFVVVLHLAVSYLGSYFISLKLGKILNNWLGRLWISIPVSLLVYLFSFVFINLFFGAFLTGILVGIFGHEVVMISLWFTLLALPPFLHLTVHGSLIFVSLFSLISKLRSNLGISHTH